MFYAVFNIFTLFVVVVADFELILLNLLLLFNVIIIIIKDIGFEKLKNFEIMGRKLRVGKNNNNYNFYNKHCNYCNYY